MNTREALTEKYIQVRQKHDKLEEELKNLRLKKREKMTEHNKTEDQLKAIQSVGMLIGEVLNKQSEEKFLVKVNKFPKFEGMSGFYFGTGRGFWMKALDLDFKEI